MNSVIIKNGEAIAYTTEELKSGQEVQFGYVTVTEELHADQPKILVNPQTGKVSNAKKWQKNEILMELPIASRLNIGLKGYDDQFLI